MLAAWQLDVLALAQDDAHFEWLLGMMRLRLDQQLRLEQQWLPPAAAVGIYPFYGPITYDEWLRREVYIQAEHKAALLATRTIQSIRRRLNNEEIFNSLQEYFGSCLPSRDGVKGWCVGVATGG